MLSEARDQGRLSWLRAYRWERIVEAAAVAGVGAGGARCEAAASLVVGKEDDRHEGISGAVAVKRQTGEQTQSYCANSPGEP